MRVGRRIKIWHDHPISNSSLGNDLKVLEEMKVSDADYFNLNTNCFEFLDNKYLLDGTVDAIMVIYGDDDKNWLLFKLDEKDGKKITPCFHNGKMMYKNIRPVNNIRKMWRGGYFDATNKSNLLSEENNDK